MLFENGCVMSHPTVMVRREAILSIGGYRSALKHTEDFDLWLRMSEHFELANLPDVSCHYRQHPNQVSVAHHLDQQLAHSLSLLSAKRRRQGLPDPIDSRWVADSCDDRELSFLLQSHAALKSLMNGSKSGAICKTVVDAIEVGVFSHSKRRLVLMLAQVTQYALQTYDFGLAWRSFKLSSGIDFIRTLKSLRIASDLKLQSVQSSRGT